MPKKLITLAAAIGLASAGTMASTGDGHGHGHHGTETIAAAVAQENRPEAARALDEARKPAETLAWLGLKPGMDAGDILPGNGYWSEIMGHVVGAEGSVTALRAVNYGTSDSNYHTWQDLEARAPQVSQAFYQFEHFAYAPDSFDFVITNLNYHDLYVVSERFDISRSDPDEFTAGLYAAMRPGGIIGVIDHTGEEGDTRAIAQELHRVAPATVIADFERAGFELVGQSDILANPDDDHTLNVFNPAVRGKTDRFLLKFRKPAA